MEQFISTEGGYYVNMRYVQWITIVEYEDGRCNIVAGYDDQNVEDVDDVIIGFSTGERWLADRVLAKIMNFIGRGIGFIDPYLLVEVVKHE